MNDLRFAGVIEDSLWDVAGWSGVAWLLPPPGTRHPPGLGFVFKDAESGAAIFRGWRSRFGDYDVHGVIVVTVITGTHPIHGEGTSIFLGTDSSGVERQDYAEANLVLEPRTHTNSVFMFFPAPVPRSQIEIFKSERRKYDHVYFLAPCYLHPQAGASVPQFDFMIRKRRISFRDFSDIETNESEYAALLA